MAAQLARAERAALCDTFEQVGPSAPTLCEGWSTSDLAAHLIVRERRPDAMPGVVLPGPLHAYTERVMDRLQAAAGWPGLVARVRSGPPVVPFGLPGLDDAINTMEFYVHHEDVLRAAPSWSPRVLSPELAAGLRSRLRLLAPMFRRVRGAEVVLVTPDGARTRVRRGPADNSVTVTGEPAELTLYAFGRQEVAAVQVDGSAGAVAALDAAALGL